MSNCDLLCKGYIQDCENPPGNKPVEHYLNRSMYDQLAKYKLTMKSIEI